AVGYRSRLLEDHVVGQQDLVHPPPRLEDVQALCRLLALYVARLVVQVAAGGVDRLALRLQQPGHRVLRQPVDLQAGYPPPQLARDRDIPAGVTEADGRGDEERPPGTSDSPPPHLRAGRR